MRRISAILILSAMLISVVAPFVGADDKTITTDVAAQTKTTKQLKNQTVQLHIEHATKQIDASTRLYEENEEILKEQKNEVVEIISYQDYSVPTNRGFKSYMSYKSITSKSSQQYKLQHNYAYTGNYGIRQVDGRYCIAIGTFSDAEVGTYVDLILENQSIIPCIISDFKADIHTDNSNMITTHNGCISEFIVDKSSLYQTAKQMGDISYCCQEWKSPVKAIRVYEKNVFNGE